MSIERVREYFKQYGLDEKVMEFEVSSATVQLAAEAVGVIPARIAKTLSFKVNDKPIVIVTAGDAKVDNQKYKACFKTKAKMLSSDEALELIGYAVGGVCPFAVNEGVTAYTDISMKRFETLFPACGTSNSAIELTPEQIYEYSGSVEWVDVCTNWE